MTIANFSIKRPIFITCVVILMLVTGGISLNRIGVDIFPPIDFPLVTVTTTYPGASPEEIEKLISKPLEEQISTISGLEELASRNYEGYSVVIARFSYETEIKYAEEKMREKVALARNDLPDDLTDDPLVKQWDFTDLPVITMAVSADLSRADLYDLVKEKIKPLIEQVDGVGEVTLTGGTRREIQVELDRNKLNAYEIPALTVAESLKSSGANIPVGKFDRGSKSTTFKTVGEFKSVDQIKKTVVSFSGDVASAVTLDKLGRVIDGAEEEDNLAYIYYQKKKINEEEAGFLNKIFREKKEEKKEYELQQCIILDVYKQSGANSVAVADGVMERIDRVNAVVKKSPGNPRLTFVYDTAKYIRLNIRDVEETMIIGILLAVLVVYLFLGNIRSTVITGVAIPNSIIGAFVLMYFMGFTMNLMSLMALSLAVGLLVDDAIVVRENIYRKIESGMSPLKAAERGTTEVMLAVIATTLTILAVFFPIAFMEGIVGRFFKQFGLTVVFAMSISLFDALTVAPLLSAYFAGKGGKANNAVVKSFDRFQNGLDYYYEKIVNFSLSHPLIIIGATTLIFFGSLGAFALIGKTFEPEADQSEFSINIQVPVGTSLSGTQETAIKIADLMKSLPELNYMTMTVGNSQSEDYKATINIFLVPLGERDRSSMEIKAEVRKIMKQFAFAQPSVDEYMGGDSNKPFILNIRGENLEEIQEYSVKVMKKLEEISDLTELATSYQPGKPEFQIHLDENKMQMLGVNHRSAGMELRYHVEGGVVGKFRDKGLEYDVRLRLKPDQRDLKSAFANTRVPNMQYKMIPLSAVAEGKDARSPAKILRQSRGRVVQIMANIAPGGAVGTALSRTRNILEKEIPMPPGISYSFIGAADSFGDMTTSMITAFTLALIFIYLVLASLYESFFTPVTIFLALPPAIAGGAYALFFTGKLMDMFCMIGLVMLLGLVSKNSILLVDFALDGVRAGLNRKEAIKKAGRARLRPILMTSFAMLAGTLPLALGIGEAAQYRQGMGIVIIGGLILSTLITLVVVPAVFEYIDIFREFIESKFRPEEMAYEAHLESADTVQVNENIARDDRKKPRPAKKKNMPKN
ncbi:MAG TPA: efflux RND transporter permease subunit [Spirochaetota bacterium]|nr:efflux RND transporter permease subunit [Spirochaetota bacterium]HPI87790.1 efflux RND transporter permease subunit [Spirochaetota bacterium]HPR47034.1 efflux RND transporter permease subunit [Spirochaetota bacterium]